MPRHISLIFPGQGSQSIGMLNSFSEDELSYVTKISEEVLGIDIIDYIKNGPEEDLNKTSVTQPALLIASYLYYKKFLDLFAISPDLLAGHSLGEYSALLASNSIKFDDAVSLVHKRGKCMENSQKGSMFAILNLDINKINHICKAVEEETGQIISPANINSPNQVVIAGSDEAAIIAAEKCKEAGAKRCIQLKVSVASHCNLMYEAASFFKKELDEHKFYTPDISIIHNVDAKIEEDITNIPNKLLEQLTLPVQWTKTMEYIKTFNGIVIECGPGKVLSGLAKTNGLDNVLSMSSETFEDDLKKIIMRKEVVFISGASRGIGTAIAESFAQLGHTVIGTSRSEFKFESKQDNLIPLALDIANRNSINNCVEYLKDNNLKPSILINNAGITSDQLFLRMKDEEWDNVIATNLTGTFNLTKALIKNMIKNKYGRIINISSVSGLMGNPGQVNYSSAKAGLSGFTKSLAKEVGSRGITVNSVAPGFIETDMTAYLDDNAKTKLIEGIPLKRLGSVQDISDLVIYLSSKDASYITGQTISVDGGLFMY